MNVLPSRPEAAAPSMSERRVGLIGALLVALGPVSMALFTPAMPQIAHDFATTDSMVKMTVSLYFAGFALAQLVLIGLFVVFDLSEHGSAHLDIGGTFFR